MKNRPLATIDELCEVAAEVHRDPASWGCPEHSEPADPALCSLAVLVWNGRVFTAIGNDAAVASRLAPSTRLYSRGRGRPLEAIVRHPRCFAERAKRSGVTVAFAMPEWVDTIPADHEIGTLRGRDWRRQFCEAVHGGANIMIHRAAK